MIDLVDIGVGNIGSVSRCLERLYVPYQRVGPNKFPEGGNPILLPGVGSFSGIMNALRTNEFDQYLKTLIQAGTPYLGLCVGLQILFDESDESPGIQGLSLLPGRVVRYTQGKVPQVGWNLIYPRNPAQSAAASGYVYFVNSYYAQPQRPDDVLYEGHYHVPFCAAVQRDNITAFQFHPEKSGVFGHTLIHRWVNESLQQESDLFESGGAQ
jgi:glutamine amidotransferase